MLTNRNLLIVAAVVICSVLSVWFSTSIQGESKTYEIQPQIAVPEYRTDAARAIDAYERMMELYIGLADGNLGKINSNVQDILRKMESIDSKLTDLSSRIGRIEKSLAIEQPLKSAEQKTEKN
ncbi:MAG: hypothetical protein NTW55_01625 [Planctomycetota bacterium]|nr:hypothetical protein [Planctomycetota bacterium]